MTIKKPANEGGATIADRFKLDVPEKPVAKSGGPATTAAMIAGVVALGLAGILAYILWQHWQYLMPA